MTVPSLLSEEKKLYNDIPKGVEDIYKPSMITIKNLQFTTVKETNI